MKVCIVTEGGSKIGYGHITRCISLYQGFRDVKITPLLIVNGDPETKEVLGNAKNMLFDWTKNDGKLLRIIENCDIVIVDSYIAGRRIYNQIARVVKLPVYIDDNIRINYPRGIVVNGTLLSEHFQYAGGKDAIYLLGSRYTPLRKEFWTVPVKPIESKVQNILLTFGGEDPRSLSTLILKYLAKQYPLVNKQVIIGRGFSRATVNAVKSVKDSRTRLYYNASALLMKKTMTKCDIAISAAGQTLYELASAGVPTIAIQVAHNQRNNIKGWLKTGAISFAGHWDAKDITTSIGQEIDLLQSKRKRTIMSRRAKELVDGAGTKRIIENLIKYAGV